MDSAGAGGEGESGVGAKVLRLVSSSEVQLLICATLYGSLTVAFRLLYSQPGPPGASILFLLSQPGPPGSSIFFNSHSGLPGGSMANFVCEVMAAACFIPNLIE